MRRRLCAMELHLNARGLSHPKQLGGFRRGRIGVEDLRRMLEFYGHGCG
ncbi:MAG: hypothetical protein GY894_03955 [Planctomycetes bacterium]|nr:hypothetical protein [Planctomycetota bacterium]